MKIMICGSLAFAKEMMQMKKDLEDMSHKVMLPPDAENFAKDSNLSTDNHEEDLKHCIKNDIFRKAFKLSEESDAVLVLNKEKNGIEGYIGPAVLMELGVAHYLNKKIFLLNPPANIEKQRSTHEVLIMQPIIINGDLSLIK